MRTPWPGRIFYKRREKMPNKFEIFQQTFTKCAPFFRDTHLSDDILDRYKIGLFLQEPTFCDATYKSGGFVAPHRFLIIVLQFWFF